MLNKNIKKSRTRGSTSGVRLDGMCMETMCFLSSFDHSVIFENSFHSSKNKALASKARSVKQSFFWQYTMSMEDLSKGIL